jgi:ssDNA-binding Zn-finger/Zn-ribbon topoisomerase 1
MSTAVIVTEVCPDCGARLVLRRNRRDEPVFIGCSKFPGCDFTEAYVEREQRLAERIAELEDSMVAVPSSPVDVLSKELRALAARFHPDRHGGSRLANDVCAAILELRGRVNGRSAA